MRQRVMLFFIWLNAFRIIERRSSFFNLFIIDTTQRSGVCEVTEMKVWWKIIFIYIFVLKKIDCIYISTFDLSNDENYNYLGFALNYYGRSVILIIGIVSHKIQNIKYDMNMLCSHSRKMRGEPFFTKSLMEHTHYAKGDEITYLHSA